MNTKLNLLVAASLMLVGGTAMAESTYGYDASGTSTTAPTAKADLEVVVKVPKLILLRVGANDTTVSTATIQGKFNQIPGPNGANPLVDGSNQATGWNNGVPTMANASSSVVTVRAWTNSSGGGKVSAAVQSPFTEAGLAAKVTVTDANPVGGGLPHPGADLTGTVAGAETAFGRNTLVGSDWKFTVSGADLATLPAGEYSQTMRYTATSF